MLNMATTSVNVSMSTRGFRVALIVAVMLMLRPFSMDTYLPSFPDIAHAFHAADWQLQQTLSLYMLSFGAMTLVYGPLSDAYGRRRLALTTLVLHTLFSIGCALAENFYWLLIMRIGQGLTASAVAVVGRAVVRDSFSGVQAQKVMMLLGVGPAVASILGGHLHDAYGWRTVFWFLTAFGACLFVWTAKMLPETHTSTRQSANPRAIAVAYWHSIKNLRFMLLVLSLSLNFGGIFLYIAGAPTLLYQHLGLGSDQFSYLFVPLVVAWVFGAFISGRRAGRFTPEQTVAVGSTIMFVASVINLATSLLLPPRLWAVVGPGMIYVVGLSMTMSSLILLALDCMPNRRGLAAAVQNFVPMLFLALITGAMVPLLARHLWMLAAGMFVFASLSMALWFWYRRLPPVAVQHSSMS